MPNDIFDQDRLIWRIMSRIMDIIILGFMWTITSLPVFTIGASTSALYYVALKMARNQEGYLWKGYWKAFRENFKQATVLWLIIFVIGAFFAFDIYFYYEQENQIASGIQGFLIGMLVLLIIIFIYLFPIISRFSNSSWTIFKMSVFMPFKHFGWTVVLLLMFAFTVFLSWYIIPYILIGFGVYGYASAYIFVRIFKPYEDAIRKSRGEPLESDAEEENPEK